MTDPVREALAELMHVAGTYISQKHNVMRKAREALAQPEPAALSDDKTPQCVKDVLRKPGKYRFDQREFYWFFEVDEHARVHQLNPDTMLRDGVLSNEGWGESEPDWKVTPL